MFFNLFILTCFYLFIYIRLLLIPATQIDQTTKSKEMPLCTAGTSCGFCRGCPSGSSCLGSSQSTGWFLRQNCHMRSPECPSS
uniref:Uncharacterized protein n=1 Tax=Oryzias sinensis TaxID=183150 RepID=A0A8C8DZF4_9TELE